MCKRPLITLLLSLSTVAASAISTLDSLLTVLDNEVAHSAQYCAAHQQRIDSLEAIRPMTKALQLRIAREYQYFQSDSARTRYMALLQSPEPYRTQAYMGLVQLSSSIGKYGGGMALLENFVKRC